MPYKSDAQRRFFNSKEGKAKVGAKVVEEFNEESKGQKNLPDHVKSKDGLIQKVIRITFLTTLHLLPLKQTWML